MLENMQSVLQILSCLVLIIKLKKHLFLALFADAIEFKVQRGKVTSPESYRHKCDLWLYLCPTEIFIHSHCKANHVYFSLLFF